MPKPQKHYQNHKSKKHCQNHKSKKHCQNHKSSLKTTNALSNYKKQKVMLLNYKRRCRITKSLSNYKNQKTLSNHKKQKLCYRTTKSKKLNVLIKTSYRPHNLVISLMLTVEFGHIHFLLTFDIDVVLFFCMKFLSLVYAFLSLYLKVFQ